MPASQDLYNPTPTVEATTQTPFDYQTVRADPNEFGAQVGQAAQGLGKTLENVSKQASQDINQYQGMLNEHEASTAEMNLAVQGGEVYDQYKQQEGLAAANTKDKYISDYLAVNDKIRNSISNPAAQRAYDQLATRRMAFAIQDMNSYAADQTKKAVRDGFSNSMSLAIDSTSKYAVASDPAQFGFQLGTIYHNLNALFTDPQTGKYKGLDATQNKDGTLSYDTSTQEGRVAQADYDTVKNAALSKAWDNRAYALAFDPKSGNITKAVDFIEENQDKIPAGEYNKLVKEFHGPYMAELSRSGAEDIFGKAYSDWQANNGTPGVEKNVPNNLGNVKTKDNKAFLDPATPTDGVIATVNNLRGDLYKGKTVAQIAQTWTGEPAKAQVWADTVSKISGIKSDQVPDLSNPQVVKSLLKGMTAAEKGQGDRGLFTDAVISDGVQSAFSGKQAVLNNHPSNSSYTPFADYLGMNEDNLIQAARDHAAALGYDVTVQDEIASRVQARISQEVSAKTNQTRAYKDAILSKVTDDSKPITSVSSLDYSSDPTLKQQWVQLQADDPYAAQAVRNIIDANAKGTASTYGTDAYTHLQNILSGKENDPGSLGNYVTGPNGPLTATGYKVLSQEMKNMQTPEGQAFAHQESEFFKNAYGVMTGTSTYPGINPVYTKAGFDKFIMEALPQIQAGRAHGKTAGQLFDPKSPDYVGKGIKGPTQAQINASLADFYSSGAANKSKFNIADLDKVTDGSVGNTNLNAAIKAKLITKEQAIEYAHKRNWIKPDAPKDTAPAVPLPQF